MSISERKIEANRENAQKSTGPQSIEMKEKVSQNAVQHGLTGKFSVLPCESQKDYNNFLQQLINDEKPVGSAEVELVVKMAQHTWMSKRALRLQDGCFSMEPTPPEHEGRPGYAIGVRTTLPNYLRYHAAHDRAYARASKELRERRKERQLEERGFVSQKHAEADQKRKAEKHTEAMAFAKVRRQLAEIRLGEKLAKVFPPDFPGFANPEAFGLPNLPFSPNAIPQRP